MKEIKKMRRYIERTRITEQSKNNYDMTYRQGVELSALEFWDAVCLVFDYGRAKGYRAAKAEVRKAVSK